MWVRAIALVAGVAALELTAGGCSYGWLTGGSERAAKPARASHASLPPPQRLLGTPRPVSRPASTAELRWLGRFSRWWAAMTTDLAFVADTSDRILAGESPSPPRNGSLEEVFDRLGHCQTELSRRIAYPKTARLRRLHALLGDTCRSVEGVAAVGSRILADGADPDLVEDWRVQWSGAERLLLAVFRRLARFDPAARPALPVRGGTTQTSRVEPRFGKAASTLASKRVRVRCWSQEDWGQLVQQESLYTGGGVTAQHLGFAAVGGSDVSLAPEICLGLTTLVYGGQRPSGGKEKVLAALSVGTLAHESYHSRGVADERTTECFAMQTVSRTARLLGVERPYARDLSRVYWRQVYPFETRAYRTRACRPDGSLDLRPKRAAWP